MPAETYDYVIVGAGAAGCVLAYRLSEDPSISVAVIEAGGRDTHPFFRVPKAVPKLMGRAANIWAYPTKAEPGTGNKVETWLRGRVVGGSTSINGLMYVRGQPADFDAIAELSSDDWNWRHIGAAYAALEGHELGAEGTRGGDGPLKLSLPGKDVRGPWHEAVIAAGHAMGLPVKEDVNVPDDDEGVGYNPRTVHKGRRVSAATAFLRPAERRRNVTVITDATVDRVVLEETKAVAIRYLKGGAAQEVRATRDIILAAGAMASPGILERSGIGDPAVLEPLGITVRHALTGVGANLIEHRALLMQWRLTDHRYSFNNIHRGWRLVREVVRYGLTGKGPLSSATFDMGLWLKSRPGLNRPDVQFLVAPHSLDFSKMGRTTEPFPGMSLVVYPLRPTSAGTLHITSADPEASPCLSPNHRDTEEDRRAMVGAIRAVRRFTAQSPLKEIVATETMPGPQYETDEQILQAYDQFATCGYHAVGSCRMGKDAASVVDSELRVRGIAGLRVMDTSIMPVVPSGNTQGPTMAMAWRAADVIRRGG
ncbi:GMC family oxidoreductase N-terminal domain-containing protein [Sphingomonas sp. CGMCC 1.13654]|uniref:GMC family oxidoreductase N-terminal domain-containing protein n=1 Tax=Sphingomonas chungangi TaxID=2683589 RepID=A0A838L3S0_9SPHN|nr:GMC family oxidoreductase N-terminal domain-containing protein [Sphingomonas chungangi]MBA2933824.1 GMC family oxidoreductase N-terminal domain-containing protein [Sphingomonas chungangi]MVW55154.1 NAD(P)-binding protein [Sphingomonas chungangi]